MDHLRYDQSKKSPLIINLDITETGERVECRCDGERFQCKDFLQEKPFVGLRYQRHRGWVIMQKLAEIVLYFRPYCVVEIGAGESSMVLGELTEKLDIVFHSVDIKPQKQCKYHANHFYHNTTSDEFMKTFKDNPAVVLIDADHRYESAKKEFDFFFDKLVSGGLIFLHDTMPPHEAFIRDTGCGDVYKLRQELERRRKDLDCMTFPYTAGYMGLTVVIKKEQDRRYFEK